VTPSIILLSGAAGLFCLGLLMLYFAIKYRDDDWAFFLVWRVCPSPRRGLVVLIKR
jgi:hypothetical protein